MNRTQRRLGLGRLGLGRLGLGRLGLGRLGLGRLGMGLLAFGVLAGVPATAHGAEKVDDYNVRWDFVLPGIDNPCTPEYDDITLDASLHAVGMRWNDDDGSWRSQIHGQIHFSGTAADGTSYVGSDRVKSQTEFEDGVVRISADDRDLLVSRGDGPNFSLRYKVYATFDLAGTFSSLDVVKDEATCRG